MTEPGLAGGRVLDAPQRNLVDTLAPEAARPFLRLARIDRPIGWQLLLLPCRWSAALAAIASGQKLPDFWHLVLFLIGAIAMRGAGSTYNDLIDRNLDARVERTRSRPLPSGQVTPRGAVTFMALQGVIGLSVLLQFNRFAILIGLLSLLPVAAYPLMKRITDFPQIVLGLTFAWGGLMGWAAAFGQLDPAAYFIYTAAIAWTFGYDTIYAIQDLEDDALVGIRSTALYFGSRVASAVGTAFTLAILCAGIALILAGSGLIAAAGLAGFAAHLAWQTLRIDRASPERALKLFRSNRDAGLILFAGLCLDAWLR